MSSELLTDHDYLVELTEKPTPAFISDLSDQDLHELREYVEAIVSRDEAGLDKLFESMSMMMKFIPNFILHSITPKYIEPSIAARITNKLSVKQSLGVTGGLPIEYIGETAAYMDSRHAAEILSGLKLKMIEPVIEYVNSHHPLKGLDILEFASNAVLTIAARIVDPKQFDQASMTKNRQDVIDRMRALT